MLTGRREIEMEIFVGFGASETFMTPLSRGLLESCVTACEGAGTVIASSPTLAFQWYVHQMPGRCMNLKSSMMWRLSHLEYTLPVWVKKKQRSSSVWWI